MDISVTAFKAQCLELIRRAEKEGRSIVIHRRGKIVARLEPPPPLPKTRRPWEELRSLGGILHAKPGESVLHDKDFQALR